MDVFSDLIVPSSFRMVWVRTTFVPERTHLTSVFILIQPPRNYSQYLAFFVTFSWTLGPCRNEPIRPVDLHPDPERRIPCRRSVCQSSGASSGSARLVREDQTVVCRHPNVIEPPVQPDERRVSEVDGVRRAISNERYRGVSEHDDI